MSPEEPTCVFRPRDDWQGDLLVQYLRAHQIDAHLANRASVGLWGDGSLSLAKLEILVPGDQSEQASTLIEEYFETNRPACD